MGKLLYIEASPRKERSHAIAVAHRFLDAYRAADPGAEVDTLDLWRERLPSLDGDTIDAKYAILGKREHSDSQARAWREVEAAVARFKAADDILFAVPMWNFGVPYVLKHYIDIVTQPGLTFSFSPETGFKGLVTGKRAVVIYASGGDYSPGTTNPRPDLQKPFFETWLRFIGIDDVESVRVEPTIGQPHVVEAAMERASEHARDLANRIRSEASAAQ